MQKKTVRHVLITLLLSTGITIISRYFVPIIILGSGALALLVASRYCYSLKKQTLYSSPRRIRLLSYALIWSFVGFVLIMGSLSAIASP